MLTIRATQIDVFEALLFGDHTERMARLVKSIAPGASAPQFAQSAIDRAARYALVEESDIEVFVRLSATYGLDFEFREEMAWAARILEMKDQPAGACVRLVERMCGV